MTSDLHFGHSKIWSKWKYREPDFEEDIIKKWNNVVAKTDVVLNLGDLSLTNKIITKAWTKQLNGRKYLVRGNHDNHSETWYRDCEFKTIPAAYQRFGQKDGGHIHILFTHEPILRVQRGWFNIHGHLHGDCHRGIKTTNRHFDVGVDANNLRPIRLYNILAKFKKVK